VNEFECTTNILHTGQPGSDADQPDYQHCRRNVRCPPSAHDPGELYTHGRMVQFSRSLRKRVQVHSFWACAAIRNFSTCMRAKVRSILVRRSYTCTFLAHGCAVIVIRGQQIGGGIIVALDKLDGSSLRLKGRAVPFSNPQIGV